mmetsp:Transcript_9469/g.16174  ORF Transcript_9469/g.16174 Transcript_9469/m.16174 type:complete len:261 (-) Transcript_9469:526-1308(-)
MRPPVRQVARYRQLPGGRPLPERGKRGVPTRQPLPTNGDGDARHVGVQRQKVFARGERLARLDRVRVVQSLAGPEPRRGAGPWRPQRQRFPTYLNGVELQQPSVGHLVQVPVHMQVAKRDPQDLLIRREDHVGGSGSQVREADLVQRVVVCSVDDVDEVELRRDEELPIRLHRHPVKASDSAVDDGSVVRRIVARVDVERTDLACVRVVDVKGGLVGREREPVQAHPGDTHDLLEEAFRVAAAVVRRVERVDAKHGHTRR